MGKRFINVSGNRPFTILSSGFGKAVVLILILFFSPLYSQEGFGTTHPQIILKCNAKIYSSDPDFNQQFISQENTDYEIRSSGKAYIISPKVRTSARNLSKKKIKKVSRSIDQDRREKVQQNISDFERQKKSFDFCNIDRAPFSRELPHSSDSNRNYIVPSVTSNDFSKVCVFQYKYVPRLVLDLYVGKYHYFNSRSLNFCFSEFFSVRPPPFL